MSKLILLRHGQSIWNKENIFTGWVDIPLSSEGIEEALKAGEEIKNVPIDLIFSSHLIRGIMTALLAMSCHTSGKTPVLLHPEDIKMQDWGRIHSEEMEEKLIPMYAHCALNERMYGSLQGLNKQKVRAQYGEEQVQMWRRSFDIPPPGGESLKMTSERTLPYFEKKIMPYLEKGKNVFISAHGNSLRSIVMFMEKLSEEQILKLEIPTGKPLFYEYSGGTFHGNPS